jgi:hypothetical protein
MGFLGRLLFGPKPEEQESEGMDEHLVRLHIPLPNEMPNVEEFDRYSKLEDVLDSAAQKAGAGELDGNEVGGHEFTIWLYGSNGARLAEVIKLCLADIDLPEGSKLFVRHGGVEDHLAREEFIPIR